MSYIALVDCNNFFVSCERLFNPKIVNRPAAVLSCNDGCINARSQEVKNMGVPMGAPYFQWADLLRAKDAAIFSSNFALYGDLSNRVMETLRHFNPDMEIYSIDEAFLKIEGVKDVLAFCHNIRQKVLQWTGIPVSIGIAKTKTLAKVANQTAKQNVYFKGVCLPSDNELDTILDQLEVGEIWGIGKRLSLFLNKRGIFTASHLRNQEDMWIKKNMGIVGLRIVWELKGISSLSIEEVAPLKQSMMTSRSFGRPVLTMSELREAISSFTARGGEKLRAANQRASWLQVFIASNKHSEEETYYSKQAHIVLSEPTSYTPTLLDYACKGLQTIFQPGFVYKKAGVLFGGLVSENNYQQDLFVNQDTAGDIKKKQLMSLLDKINHRYGYRALQFAAEGIEQRWQRRREMCSANFTTRWSELLTIHI